jgi:hypothetical protein
MNTTLFLSSRQHMSEESQQCQIGSNGLQLIWVSKCAHHCRKEQQVGQKSREKSEELLRKDRKGRLDAVDAKAMDTFPRLASLQNQQKMLIQQHRARGMVNYLLKILEHCSIAPKS